MTKSLYLLLFVFLLGACSGPHLPKCDGKAALTSGSINPEFTMLEPDLPEKDPIAIELEHGYRGRNNTYEPEALYYSSDWDTLFVAYKNLNASYQYASTGLTEADLVEIERYLLEQVTPPNQNRPEYRDYLKIIRIYPDNTDVITSEQGMEVAGCSSANPENGFIDVYQVRNNNFFQAASSSFEPRVNILVHEYGHVYNFYNLHLTGGVATSHYLKLRLGERYKEVYPNGLPGSKIASMDDYARQPTEIEADDFVELFYRNYEPTTYKRSSLGNYGALFHLTEENGRAAILELYQANAQLQRQRIEPIVITANCNPCQMEYYQNTFTESKKMKSKFQQHLIATGIAKFGDTWYYQVVLSSLMKPNVDVNLLEQLGTRQAFVVAKYYHTIENKPVYVLAHSIAGNLNEVCGYRSSCSMKSAIGYQLRPNYPFSYLVDIAQIDNVVISYDYLEVGKQAITVNKSNLVIYQPE